MFRPYHLRVLLSIVGLGCGPPSGPISTNISILGLPQGLLHISFHRKNSHPHRMKHGWSGGVGGIGEEYSCSRCHKPVRKGSFVPVKSRLLSVASR